MAGRQPRQQVKQSTPATFGMSGADQALTSRYMQNMPQSGSPVGRSERLVEQAQNSANTANGVVNKDRPS